MQPYYGAESPPSSGKGSRQRSPEGSAVGPGAEGGSVHRGQRDGTGAGPGAKEAHVIEGPGDAAPGDNGRPQESQPPVFRCGTMPERIESSETRNNTLDAGAKTRPAPAGDPAVPNSKMTGYYARGNVRGGAEADDDDDDEVPSPPDDDPALTGPLGLRNDAEADDAFLRGVMEKLAGMEGQRREEEEERRESGEEGGAV